MQISRQQRSAPFCSLLRTVCSVQIPKYVLINCQTMYLFPTNISFAFGGFESLFSNNVWEQIWIKNLYLLILMSFQTWVSFFSMGHKRRNLKVFVALFFTSNYSKQERKLLKHHKNKKTFIWLFFYVFSSEAV